MLRIVITLLVAAVLAAAASAAPELSGAPQACTTAQKAKRSKAVADYKKQMPKLRGAYFRRVKSAKKRRAFVRKQQAKLKALKRSLAACRRRTSPQPPTALQSADLSLRIAAAGANEVTYTLTVRNVGPATATGVRLFDSLPPELAFDRAHGSQGTCAGSAPISCELGALPSGTEATVTIVAWARSGSFTNTAEVTSQTRDPNSADNRAGAAFTVPPLPAATSGPGCSPVLSNVGNPNAQPWRPNEGPTDFDVFLQPTGEIRVAMIFVDFDDAPATQPTTSVYSTPVPAPGAWFDEVSYGRLRAVVTPIHTWFRMPKPSSAYGEAPRFGGNLGGFITDGVQAADAAVDFSSFSMIYVVSSVVSSDPGAAAVSTWTPGYAVDGVAMRQMVGSSGQVKPEVLVREILIATGLPTLVDVSVSGSSPARNAWAGGWDSMSERGRGRHVVAWHKWKQGWLDASQLRCVPAPGVVEETLAPLETPGGVKAVVVQTGASTAHVVEVRKRIGQDSELCDEGVLVYTVDALVPLGAGPLRVKGGQNGSDPHKLLRCGPLYDAPLDLGPGEVPAYEDAVLKIDVLATDGASYRVRVTRK